MLLAAMSEIYLAKAAGQKDAIDEITKELQLCEKAR
jgi:hypothetical protein